MKMKRAGIHFRLLLTGVILIIATTFTLGYMARNITHEFVQSRFENGIQFLAKYLALNSELGILIDQRAMLKRQAENLLSEKDVVKVTIFNESDEVLADVYRENHGPLSVVEVPVTVKKSKEFPWNMGSAEEERVIGRVRIDYTTEGIGKLLAVMKVRFLWITLGLSGLSVLIFYFISRSLSLPVTRLAAAARAVAAGNPDLRVEPGNLPETRELALSFNAMLDSLQESQAALKRANEEMIRQKTLARMGEFSLMIAHEFKNPLGIIKSSLDILKQDVENSSENTMIAYMEDEIRRLNHLIEEFLVFARPALPAFRETDLNAMLRECTDRFEIQINGVSLEIISDIPENQCIADADPDLLMRAVGNVLKNAIEANEQQGTVEVRAFSDQNAWHMEIRDQGPGIPDENMQKIFEPFFTTRATGTGLGLAFAAQVVGAHQGKIMAENRKEGGAVFRVELPLERG